MANDKVVVIGAGPAGIRAALALVSSGVRPTVIDEGFASGGQIYRRPPFGLDGARSPQNSMDLSRRRRHDCTETSIGSAISSATTQSQRSGQ